MLKILLIFISVGLMSYLLYHCHHAYILAYELSHPKRRDDKIDSYLSLVIKKFDFKTDDGITLKGIEIAPKMAPKGTILTCHYLGGSKEMIVPFIDPLLKAGYRVLSFDFRNHGESETAKNIKFSLKDDFFCFYKHIKQLGYEGPFGIIGFSMGSTSAIFGLDRFQDIKAAIIDSGPLIMVQDYFKYVLKDQKIQNSICRIFFLLIFLYYAGFRRMSRMTILVLNKMKEKKVLFIHGERDNIIPLSDAKFALASMPEGNGELWSIPGSRHLTNRFLKKEEYEKRIVDFFDFHLSERSYIDDESSTNIS
ncbi:alpha/beta hydrolase [Lutispora saccharofermentans]|uniref:Alpha/beta hydrolase n=1 Tax=Lutispora saccharofermentans TaxID=3024236 RepID=A0ABT1NIN0_9FIRM|nr:alpha/beta fold hydrolase [Lutispora saccharofermentans]MCQ1531135.1 alpha/beta hydrolase [Lutispora saccharofermentans]